MINKHCQENLERLQNELETYASDNGISGGDPDHAVRISKGIPLSHATSDLNFVKICESGRLCSPQLLSDKGLKKLKPEAVEVQLGTAGHVFFYAASFSFPGSSCGLLFGSSLERDNDYEGSATPFDSGGLVAHLRRPDPGESPFDFFQRHELPLSGYRDYLHDCLNSLFGAPFDYVKGEAPVHTGPIDLGGSDARRWTHETRIPKEVHLRGHHLKAVFAPRRVGLVPEIRSFLSWCSAEGFDIQVFDADRENDFANLQSACIEYLRKELK